MAAPVIEPAAGWDCHVHVFDPHRPVVPGHYRPVHRPLAAIEAQAAQHGIGHLVLVQPSVYGTDNGLMLEALQAGAGRHRGVAVVDGSVSDAELDRMHAAGVRGVRFNLVSPAGHSGDPSAALHELAPRLRERNWHVQWYVRAKQLTLLVAWQRSSRLTFVLDHLAGLHCSLPANAAAWGDVAELAGQGAWLKLSGWYRLGANEPYEALVPTIRRAFALFTRRCVWGSDWPHTSFSPDRLPTYESTLHPVRGALGEYVNRSVMDAFAGDLYDPSDLTTSIVPTP
jgi:predicted TIM-barrel fold metal-dependent hydrolase